MLNMYKDIKGRGKQETVKFLIQMEICRTGNTITEIKMSMGRFNRILSSAAKQKNHELKDRSEENIQTKKK